MAQPVEPVVVESSPRRRGCLLIGCIVLVLLVAVPRAGVWALYEAVEHAPPPEPRHADVTHPLSGAGPLRVVLHYGMGDIDVVPAPAGSPLRLQADWNASAFRFTEALRPEGDGWVYDVTL